MNFFALIRGHNRAQSFLVYTAAAEARETCCGASLLRSAAQLEGEDQIDASTPRRGSLTSAFTFAPYTTRAQRCDACERNKCGSTAPSPITPLTARLTAVYNPGDPITEPAGPEHVRLGRNLGTTPLILEVIYIKPAGKPLAEDAANPGCPFA
jgi:hypothetical protein